MCSHEINRIQSKDYNIGPDKINVYLFVLLG